MVDGLVKCWGLAGVDDELSLTLTVTSGVRGLAVPLVAELPGGLSGVTKGEAVEGDDDWVTEVSEEPEDVSGSRFIWGDKFESCD